MDADRDDTLIATYLAGDVSAFNELVQRHKSGLFAYLCSMVSYKEDAEDLFQETFLRVIAALPRYRARGRFRPWLYRIARNLARDRVRSLMVRGVPLRLETTYSGEIESGQTVPELPDGKPSPRDAAAIREKRDWIEKAIQKLPAPQKEVFLLREYAGIPFKEIARIQRCPIGTVLARMHYALHKLRAELEEERVLH